MTRVLTELPFKYAVLTSSWHGPASAVHEPSPAGSLGRASPTAPAGSSAHALPPRRSPESSTARVRLRLKPGQKGTKRLLAQYKTVELLVAERDWEPSTPPVAPDQIVGLRVAFAEVDVRERVKQAGGTWNPERRVWQLRYDSVVALGLNRRIANEPASTSGCQR